jgi:hypothetical protein
MFWVENEPAFYTHDYRGNIEIEISTGVKILEPETRVWPDKEGDSDQEGDDTMADADTDGEADLFDSNDWISS